MDPVVNYRVKSDQAHETEPTVPEREQLGTRVFAQNGTSGYVLCMSEPESNGPNWDRLFETAAGARGVAVSSRRRKSLLEPAAAWL
jgi:hypothetical protein